MLQLIFDVLELIVKAIELVFLAFENLFCFLLEFVDPVVELLLHHELCSEVGLQVIKLSEAEFHLFNDL